MEVIRQGFGILPDNELTYFSYVEALIESVDEYAQVVITKNPTSYTFRITTSSPMYSQSLLSTLLDFHNMVNIKLELSKSMKKNTSIFFSIPLNK